LELHTNQTGVVDHLWVAFNITAGPETCWGQIRFNSQLAPASDYVPQTFHVPEEYPTIQAAINAANGVITNTILVTNGIYHENLNFLEKFINLISVNGPQTTVIDGGLANPVIAFVFREGPASVIRGFTIQNGYYFNGGAFCSMKPPPQLLATFSKITTKAPTVPARLLAGGTPPQSLNKICFKTISPTILFIRALSDSVAPRTR